MIKLLGGIFVIFKQSLSEKDRLLNFCHWVFLIHCSRSQEMILVNHEVLLLLNSYNILFIYNIKSFFMLIVSPLHDLFTVDDTPGPSNDHHGIRDKSQALSRIVILSYSHTSNHQTHLHETNNECEHIETPGISKG